MPIRSGIVCAGAWCVDINVLVDRWPAEETLSTIQSEESHGGCPGYNMATALRRLGATFPVDGIGMVGDDDDGVLLARMCDALQIGREQLHINKDHPTARTFVMVDSRTGRRTFFYRAGVHHEITPNDFDFTHTTGRIVHLGLPSICKKLDAPWQGDASGWVTVLKKAKAAGLKTNIEMVSAAPEVIRAAAAPMLPYLDTIVVNDIEAGAVAEVETVKDGVTDIAACRVAAARVLERSAAELVAVHFPLGAIVATRGGEVAAHPSVAVPPAEVKSSNGAGDCFAAGILYGLHEGWPLERMVRLAHATAAVSLRDTSTTGAVLPWADTIALADRWGWRTL
jgi:sugar/nucleoside kinase (ribokinase family)